mmetsp:Transcript_60338/g.97771  ORF Transcript_60338/g.97771 Transcript_60338/m.97771 type:complete len:286 (-) Transcript_60338:556-1413(-)
METWQIACSALGCVVAVAVVWLAVHRCLLYRKGQQDCMRYRKATVLTVGPVGPLCAWDEKRIEECDHTRQLHVSCAEADVQSIESGIGIEAPEAHLPTDMGKDPYLCPRQSPGSRHAFGSRHSGPRCPRLESDQLSSPGCVPEKAQMRSPQRDIYPSSPHARLPITHGCKAGRFLDDSSSPTSRHPFPLYSFAAAVPDELSPLRSANCSSTPSSANCLSTPSLAHGLPSLHERKIVKEDLGFKKEKNSARENAGRVDDTGADVVRGEDAVVHRARRSLVLPPVTQ